MRLNFDPCTFPVVLDGCDELAPVISSLLRGWTVRSLPDGDAGDNAIILRKTEEGYQRTSPWLDVPITYRHPVNVACDFLVDLIKALNVSQPDLMCLHTAAADFGAGLVFFPDSYNSGKSTLAAHLAAQGIRVFADDVLPVRGNSALGIAPGILPRLRLPLPAASHSDFLNFIDTHRGPESDRFLYLDLEEHLLPPYGISAPIIGIVELERVAETVEPELRDGDRGQLMKKTILRNFARVLPSADILDQIFFIIEGAACYTLRYSAGDTAARLLINTFAGTGAGRSPNSNIMMEPQ